MEKLTLVKTLEELKALQQYIKDNDFIAFDTETTGVEKDSKIIGYSICANMEEAFYVITKSWNVETKTVDILETDALSAETLSLLVGKKLIGHNAIFDCDMIFNNYGISLIDYVHTDTLMLGHLLDENRSNGLKELGVSLFGEDAKEQQIAMKASVIANGGQLTKDNYDLYKADAGLIGLYGAKDAILTLKIFYTLVPILFEEGLDQFFYEDETMPLLRGPTYQLNTVGLRVDHEKLQKLKSTLEAELLEAKAFIHQEITPHVKTKYPGNKKSNTFNIGSGKQLAWLIFVQLNNDFVSLTKEGRNLQKALNLKPCYTRKARIEFIHSINAKKGEIWDKGTWNKKTKKIMKPKKISDVWNYLAADKVTLKNFANKYEWVKKYLEYAKNLKLLNTYVNGIQSRLRYNIIRPSFLQHGTTSGRYSSKNPNFTNLPRDDKRIKDCIIARPGKTFVGADYSQLEPRVFASFSKDERLLNCFKSGDDFYSVIGAEVFGKLGYSLKKDDPDSFAKKFPDLRNAAKIIALSATYGTTAPKMAPALGKSMDQAQEIIDDYFERFPSVKTLMLEAHNTAKTKGKVHNLFGRPRRMPLALEIPKVYGNKQHAELPYEARNTLNLAINHTIQSTGASIMNRASIAFFNACKELDWVDVKFVMQIHDEFIVECPEEFAEDVKILLQHCMQNTVVLPGVELKADPTIAKVVSALK